MTETFMAHNPLNATKSESHQKVRHNGFIVCYSAMAYISPYL